MAHLRKIINRSGQAEPFDRSKIVGSILAAVRTAGRSDEWIADKLAPMVELALLRRFPDQPPNVEDVAYFVEQSLRAVEDLHDVAEAYSANRSRGASLRELEEGRHAPAPQTAPSVAPLSGAPLQGWDRVRIEAALIREQHLTVRDAQAVAAAVEARILRLALPRVSTGLIRELVDIELIECGLHGSVPGPALFSVPAYDVSEAIFPRGDTPSESAVDTAAAMRHFVAESVLAQYTLATVHSPDVRDAHLAGRMELHGVEEPAAFNRIFIDVSRIATPGGGFGLEAFFSGEAHTADDVLDRLGLLLAGAGEAAGTGEDRIESVRLEHVDTAFAPFVSSPAEAARAAQSLVERAASVSRCGTPRFSVDAAAGEVDRPGSLTLTRALLDVLGDSSRQSRASFRLVMRAGQSCAGDPQSHALVERAAQRAVTDGNVEFQFVRERTPAGGRDLFGRTQAPQTPMHSAMSGVTLNLVAPLSGHVADVGAYYAELDRLLSLAVQGLAERATFIRRFYHRRRETAAGLGPRLGRMLAGEAWGRVEIVGLAEAASALAGGKPNAVASMARAILSYAGFKLHELGASHGIDARLSGDASLRAAARAARTHGRSLPHPEIIAPGAPATFSAGFCVSAPEDGEDAAWRQRLEDEAGLHTLAQDAALVLDAQRVHVSAGALMSFIGGLAARTRAHSLRIHMPLRQCGACGNMTPAPMGACPSCGANNWVIPSGRRLLFDDASVSAPAHPPARTTRSNYSIM